MDIKTLLIAGKTCFIKKNNRWKKTILDECKDIFMLKENSSKNRVFI